MPRRRSAIKLTHRQRRMRYAARKLLWSAAVAAAAVVLILADRAGFFGRAPKNDWDKYHNRQFKVVRIVDGDTLDVDIPDGQSSRTRIRLWGVDTPETVKPDTPEQHYGQKATDYAEAAAWGKTVTLQLDRMRTRDTYNRLLAYVILPDGLNLSEEIIATGHGYADTRFRHSLQRKFKKAQAEAMAERRGLWKEATDADLPYYYRGKLKLPPSE